MKTPYDVILKPVISEQSMDMAPNKKYTFKNTEEQKKVLPKYVVAVSCVFIVAYGAAKPVLDWFFSKVIILKLNEDKLNTLKGILAGCVYIALNYFAQKFFVFRKKKEE